MWEFLNKMKVCINYISSRQMCIEHSLVSLWDKYNHKYNYPVYVYYFDDIYDSPQLQAQITRHNEQNVIFKSVPYKTPDFLKEEELFYNRTDLWYPKNRFSIHRKGYLHMCHFKSNIYGYENSDLHLYDYALIHDDEAGYKMQMPYNPAEVLRQRPESFGAYFVGQRLKDGHPHQGHLDTRTGLWEFTENFIKTNNVVPKSKVMQHLLQESEAHRLYHYIKWCDTYVLKTEMFKSDLWKKWITAVNQSGGIYKYRWGDNEIITLFSYMHGEHIYNFKAVSDGLFDQGMFRNIQDYAPGVKDSSR